MEPGVERILNRSSTEHGLPPGPWLPLGLAAALCAFLGIIYLLRPLPGYDWVGWLWVLDAFVYLTSAWTSGIQWMDVGPEWIVVRRRLRSQRIPTDDVVAVDSHRHARTPLSKGTQAAYWLSIRRSSRWSLRLEYLTAETINPLLYALHRLRKPILVYDAP